jgi:hypothetical protein
MNENDPRLGWPPQYQPPSPFVTHQDMGPVLSRMGALEQGQASILQTYSHLRGDMITHFDKLEKLMEAAKPAEPSGVNLSLRELVVIACALVLAGALLGRVPALSGLMGG